MTEKRQPVTQMMGCKLAKFASVTIFRVEMIFCCRNELFCGPVLRGPQLRFPIRILASSTAGKTVQSISENPKYAFKVLLFHKSVTFVQPHFEHVFIAASFNSFLMRLLAFIFLFNRPLFSSLLLRLTSIHPSLLSLHPGSSDDSRALVASVCCSPACLCVISSSPALLLFSVLPFFPQTATQLPHCQFTVAVNSHTILCIAKADCVWRASN